MTIGAIMFMGCVRHLIFAVALASATISSAAGDVQAGQQKAAMCLGCHGVDGNSLVPNFPKLAGLGEKYLLKQMQDIRDGAGQWP